MTETPKNNGRVTKGAHDRLIFNAAGDSVKAIELGKGAVRIQVTQIVGPEIIEPDRVRLGYGATAEVELAQTEAVAFALQILQVAGVAAEVRHVGQWPAGTRNVYPADIAPLGRSKRVTGAAAGGVPLPTQNLADAAAKLARAADADGQYWMDGMKPATGPTAPALRCQHCKQTGDWCNCTAPRRAADPGPSYAPPKART
jgi:hypothetical protein